jgi:NitT/TauT family transport system ATP-binding protein
MASATTASRSERRGAAAVELAALSRTFPGGVEALRSVDLRIAAGSFTALLGPSGCGKTTILRILAGLDRASAGEAWAGIGGARAGSGETGIGYCFQEPRLLPWRSVRSNVALPLELAGMGRRERLSAAEEAIGKVGLAEFADALPATLSGGMRMRAAMARAIVARPTLLLLDEPFGALDEVSRNGLDEMLHRLWVREGFTAILVTHSIPEAVFLAERIVVLTSRPGRIAGEIEVDLPARDAAARATDAFSASVRETYRMLLAAMEKEA